MNLSPDRLCECCQKSVEFEQLVKATRDEDGNWHYLPVCLACWSDLTSWERLDILAKLKAGSTLSAFLHDFLERLGGTEGEGWKRN